MKRDDLISLIIKYPKETEFAILGQGSNEGFPDTEICVEECDIYFEWIDEDYRDEYLKRHHLNRKDVIIH